MSHQRTLNGKPARPKIELDIKIKKAIVSWRMEGYKGASEITKRLLTFWFLEDHYDASGKIFKFWDAQREAIEALIYVYEVAKYDSLGKLIKGFDIKQIRYSASADNWPKYAFKMATGSGKTFVMELAVVWQYFNKIYATDNGVRYSDHFLIIAPNLIVFDRLKESFENAKEMKNLPFVPPEWKEDFDIQVIFQSERVPEYGKGIVFLTNIQQLYERPEEPFNPVDEYLGPKPKSETDPVANWEYLLNRLAKHDDLLVMNDEGHHVHSDDLEWNKAIDKLNEALTNKFTKSLLMQLDFSATPKDLKGKYFSHIIYDYPLVQAIIDKKVKRPRIGLLEGVPPPPKSGEFAIRNKAQIDVGLKKLKEFKDELKPSGKKPVLFVICDVNRNADEVGEYLEDEAGYKGKVLVIHTDTSGDITKSDLPALRKAARNIDTNEYEVIVSVMMLKEGWDVRNVVVIVPLRALKSPILPEQILGRGLRRIDPYNDMWNEALIVIDHPSYRQLWDAEIKMGELEVDILPESKVKEIVKSIIVDANKLQYDFDIPILEGGLIRRVPEITKLDISKLPSKLFQLSQIIIPTIMYREKDLLTSKIIKEQELAFDYTDNFDVYLSYMTKAIAKKAKVPTLFSEIAPKVADYITHFLFDVELDPNNTDNVKKLNTPHVREKIREIFCSEITKLSITETPAYVTRHYRLSDTPVLHTTRSEDSLYKPIKSIFNTLSADSQYEIDFMRYLDYQSEVLAYTKVMREGMPIHILYYDQQGYIHYYIPDFIVKTTNCFYLIETKGEDIGMHPSVKYKDKAANEWCKTLTRVTNTPWKYVKIMANDFQINSYLRFSELLKVVGYTQASMEETASSP
jgi:type III restriction enzyme